MNVVLQAKNMFRICLKSVLNEPRTFSRSVRFRRWVPVQTARGGEALLKFLRRITHKEALPPLLSVDRDLRMSLGWSHIWLGALGVVLAMLYVASFQWQENNKHRFYTRYFKNYCRSVALLSMQIVVNCIPTRNRIRHMDASHLFVFRHYYWDTVALWLKFRMLLFACTSQIMIAQYEKAFAIYLGIDKVELNFSNLEFRTCSYKTWGHFGRIKARFIWSDHSTMKHFYYSATNSSNLDVLLSPNF